MASKNTCPAYFSRLNNIKSLVNKARKAISSSVIEKKKMVWLELNGCSGNIISLLNGDNPEFEYLVSQMVDLVYNNTLEAKDGNDAMVKLFEELDNDYILAVEGAVTLKENGLFNIIGNYNGRNITGLEALQKLGEAAAHVIAVGACAVHGGVSAARPNPTECVGIQDVLTKKAIKLPGCPCHPDWFLGTLAYILLYGEPPLDSKDRPLMFYNITIHDRCPRRSYFDNGIFAEKLGDKTCMFKLGCRGPVTPIDCPIRRWNSRVNWPVGDDSPCIGCAQFGFPDAMEPFITYDIN